MRVGLTILAILALSLGTPRSSNAASITPTAVDQVPGDPSGIWSLIARIGNRAYSSAIYDSAGDRVIVFGGENDKQQNDTWALDFAPAIRWESLAISGPPNGHSPCWDEVGRHFYLIDSESGISYFDPGWMYSWSFDLGTHTWHLTSPSAFGLPGTHFGSAATFDPDLGHLLVYGGNVEFFWTSDLYELLSAPDHDYFQLLDTGNPNGPGNWVGAGMAYDSRRHREVLFGGYGEHTGADVWTLNVGDSVRWHRIAATAVNPGYRAGHAFLYDAQSDRFILFGGDETGTLGLVWYFQPSDSSWHTVEATGGPNPKTTDAAVVLDTRRHRLVVYGGSVYGGNDSGVYGSVWSLSLDDPSKWQLLLEPEPQVDPPPRYAASMTFDARRERFIMCGGEQRFPFRCPVYPQWPSYSYGYPSGLWAESGDLSEPWRQLPGTTPTLAGLGVTYDVRRDQLLVFGGSHAELIGCYDGGPQYRTVSDGNLWAYSFADSTLRLVTAAGNGPSPRYRATLVVDPKRDRLLLVGGATADYSIWEHDLPNGSWRVLGPAPAGIDGELRGCLDVGRDRLWMLQLGFYSNVEKVWTVDLGTLHWTEFPTHGALPPTLYYGVAFYDSLRDRVLITDFGRTWSLDVGNGGVWSELASGGPKEATGQRAGAYDPVHDRVLTFAGIADLGSQVSSTWSLDFGDSVRNLRVELEPGGTDTPIRLGRPGVLPFVILGRGDLEATAIDPATVRVSSAPVRRDGHDAPIFHYADVDGDGLMDLVVAIEAESLSVAPGANVLVMTGSCRDAARIRGWTTFRSTGQISAQALSRSPVATLALAGTPATPWHGPLAIDFELPDASPARLEVFDVGGRLRWRGEVGSLGAGPHRLSLSDVGRAASGVYLVRLSHPTGQRVARVVLIE
jgi:hypothetical protein